MTETAQEAPSRRRGRSPNYPGIDLKLALDRARTLWTQEHHNPTQKAVVIGHWGYSAKSSGGAITFGALKRFGLLEDAGEGKVRLTPRAQGILLAEREGRTDHVAIREAALQPSLHRELWDEYGSNPVSRESMKYKLMTEKGFTANGAEEFLAEYKRTVAFAGLLSDDPGTVSPPGEDTPRDETKGLLPPPTLEREQAPYTSAGAVAERPKQTVQVTYSPDEWALIEARFPMSEKDWEAMIALLQAMKVGLVAPPGSADNY